MEKDVSTLLLALTALVREFLPDISHDELLAILQLRWKTHIEEFPDIPEQLIEDMVGPGEAEAIKDVFM